MTSTPDTTLNGHVVSELRAHMARHRTAGRTLARELGRSAFWLYRRLDGTVPMSIDDFADISFALGMSPAAVLSEAYTTYFRDNWHEEANA